MQFDASAKVARAMHGVGNFRTSNGDKRADPAGTALTGLVRFQWHVKRLLLRLRAQ